MARKITPIDQRFWQYVHKTNGCWLWTGATTFGGYGVLNGGPRPSKLVRAHRLSWALYNGAPAPDDLDVCHKCDNPPCVRPDHLFLGEARHNVADMVAKGRARGGVFGERHGLAKLSESEVRAIRKSYAAGGVSLNDLAREFDVSKKTILNIVHGRIWISV